MKLDPELTEITHPYVVSIEPINGPTFRHAFHLGTDLKVAKWFAKELWHWHNANGGCYTVALLREGKIVDTYDGRDWHRENPWHTYY